MSRTALLPILALAAATTACKDKDQDTTDVGDDTGEAAWRPDLVCPGDDGCTDNTGELLAGVASLPITPTCFETWDDVDGNGEYSQGSEPFYDCGCDWLCDGDEGYPGPDEGEGDGEFQAVWIAGFGTARPAQGVHDELWARAIAVRSGDTTVAIVSVDLVGYFFNEVQTIRGLVADAGVDFDQVIVQSTHVHEGPDTLGQWGERPGKTGIDRDYMDGINVTVAEAVAEAVADLQPVSLYLGSANTATPFGSKGTHNTIRDSRDPVIIDEMLETARFEDASGNTLATLVNWGNHPEALDSDNTQITADFVHYVRETVESGVDYESYTREGLGGTAIYVQACVGGLMTPLGITVTDGDGNDYQDSSFDKAAALGHVVGELALDAVDGEQLVSDPLVSVRAEQLYIPVDNVLFQAGFIVGMFDRPVYNYDPDEDLDETNVPELLTEVDIVRVGPLALLSVPGELFPELAIGGYDGTHVNTDEVDFISADNPNPPDVSQAPSPPYFKDLLGGDQNWIVGLGNDEIGYLVPPYDYQLDDNAPWFVQPEGDHYEETNSVGPEAVPRISEVVDTLATWEP